MLSVLRATRLSEVAAAAHLFDGPVDQTAAHQLLSAPGHHLLLAYAHHSATPVGFVTGVEMTHPDKGTEMFVYELGVDEAHRRQGVATALLAELEALARRHGCYGMWVLTDLDNEAALATYRRAGAAEPTSHVMASWTFDQSR